MDERPEKQPDIEQLIENAVKRATHDILNRVETVMRVVNEEFTILSRIDRNVQKLLDANKGPKSIKLIFGAASK